MVSLRTEIGELTVQGLDYVYNLQGWLKSLNSNTLDKTRDPGKDGEKGTNYMTNQPDVHARFARDVFGFSLGYYEDDYAAIDASKDNFIADESSQSSNLHNLYNGNISHGVTALLDEHHEPLDIHLKRYRYDQLNRLKSQTVYTSANVIANNNWNSATTNGDYDVSLTYDENGNIMTLDRHGYGSNRDMDDLVYTYNSGTNQLDHVTENAPGTPFDDYEGSTSGNYQYNEIGQLISDDEAEIANIEWNVYGKVKSITRTTGSTQPDLEFRYDPFGNRIMKVEKTKDGSGNLEDETEWTYTHYRTDASGNTMAVYETKASSSTELDHSIKERYLYGNKRLGVESEDKIITELSGTTFNGLDGLDLGLASVFQRNTGNAFKVTLKLEGSTSNSSNLTFEATYSDGSVHYSSWCSQTGDAVTLTTCFKQQIDNEAEFNTFSTGESNSFIVASSDPDNLMREGSVIYRPYNGTGLEIEIERLDTVINYGIAEHQYDQTHYELSNHLGNVQSVLSNRYWFNTSDEKSADIVSYKDYFPYGSRTPGRSWNSNVYRYGFNGMEGDPEMKGTGNHYTTFFRQYDPRLGRWFSTDPVVQPSMSPYQAFDLNPILIADPRGDKGGEGNGSESGDKGNGGNGAKSNAIQLNEVEIVAGEKKPIAYTVDLREFEVVDTRTPLFKNDISPQITSPRFRTYRPHDIMVTLRWLDGFFEHGGVDIAGGSGSSDGPTKKVHPKYWDYVITIDQGILELLLNRRPAPIPYRRNWWNKRLTEQRNGTSNDPTTARGKDAKELGDQPFYEVEPDDSPSGGGNMTSTTSSDNVEEKAEEQQKVIHISDPRLNGNGEPYRTWKDTVSESDLYDKVKVHNDKSNTTVDSVTTVK